MKTKGLTIVEAVRMLQAERCHYIQNERTGDAFTGTSGNGIFTYQEVLDTYTLIDPRPLTELVEEKRWMNEKGAICHEKYDPYDGEEGQWVTVSYQRKVPEPEPVEWEGEVVDCCQSGYWNTSLNSNTTGEFKTLPKSFIGKRVLCRIIDKD